VTDRPIGILYEHPEWFKPLFAEMDRRSVPYAEIDAAGLHYDPARSDLPYALVFNRMSPSAWTRGHHSAVHSTLDYLRYLEGAGVPVVNGSRAYGYEISKARQLRLLQRLEVPHPRARVVNRPDRIPDAAQGLTYPVLVKPNIGGSGAGIASFEDPSGLGEAVASGALDDLGLDGTALVQEHLPARGGTIVRVEVVGGGYLYAIRIRLVPGSFNLCPADYCDLPGIADGVSGDPVEGYTPPDDLIQTARRIVAAAGMDVAGVEYLVDDRTGVAHFYDINALSNFVADAPEVIGFDPFVNLVDFLADRAGTPS
jgi:hypothetical protein